MRATISGAIALLLIGFSFGLASPASAATDSTMPASAPAATPQTTLPEMEDEVMCPICGTLLNLSHAPAAERERVYIRKLIAQGKSKDEIKDALVAEYGPQVLALPDDKGFNVFAYLIPFLIFIVGGLIVLFAVIAWRRNRNRDDGPDGKDPDSGPKGQDSDRLDEDIASFDL